MKNVFKLLGAIALVAIIGFSFAACGDGGNEVEKKPVMRTVTFDANGGTVEGNTTKEVQVEVGEKVTLPADPVNDPKKFWGWFDGKTEGKYGNKFNAETPVTWDMTLYARWGDTVPPELFNVTFDANGGTYTGGGTTQVIQVYKDEKVNPPSPGKNDGTMVSGWYSNAAGTGTAFDKDTPVTVTLTLYAQWKKPEDMPDKDRWGAWGTSGATATLDDYSVANDGVCTVTVGGTPEKQGQDSIWRAWTVSAEFFYSGTAGKTYMYTFEAWTKSGTRDLHVQYYEDNDNSVYLGETVPITTERKTYTVYGQDLPKGGLLKIQFQLADQLGTVNLKVTEIKEYTLGKLTITNFSDGSSALSKNRDAWGSAFWNSPLSPNDTYLLFCAVVEPQTNITVTGSTITIPVWEVSYDRETVKPYTGTITVATGGLEIYLWYHDGNWNEVGGVRYTNKAPIIFTNGNATINFATQMQVDDGDNGGSGGSATPPGP